MPSRSYNRLETEIKRLDSCYLPATTNPLGPSADQQEKVRAFYVFSHAAVERYLEDRSIALARRAVQLFVNSGTKRKAMLGLAMYCLPVKGDRDPPLRKASKFEKRATLAYQLLGFHTRAVQRNNGIKRNDLLSLVCPVGVDEDELDPVWLTFMDAFGGKRGLAVHDIGEEFHAKHSPDPQTARDEIRYLLDPPGFEGLNHLDALLDRC